MEKINLEDKNIAHKRGVEEIEKAIQKLDIVNKNKWWLRLSEVEPRLSEVDPRLFAMIINLVAKIGEGVAKNDPKFEARILLTDQISRWVSQGLIKLNPDLNKPKDVKGESPIQQVDQKINTLKNDPTGAKIFSKVNNIDLIVKDLDEKVNKNLLISRSMYDQGRLNSEENRAMYNQGVEQVLNKNLADSEKIEKFLITILHEIKANYENLLDLKKEVEKVKDQSSQRIYIRDSVQILEIKEEVERFVKSDLIRKISLTIMPLIESLKDSKPEELPRALEDLFLQCRNAGLIPTEKLFG
jgi:hypothetical protein